MTSLLAIEGVGARGRGAVDALDGPAAPPASAPKNAFDAALAAAATGKTESIGQKFEAATLTTFLATLLPSEESEMWGSKSGAMWKNLFAENLAKSVAANGGIGIAATIDRQTAAKMGGSK